jgi:hypothetical protein
VKDRGQENKMKLHVGGLVERCDELDCSSGEK